MLYEVITGIGTRDAETLSFDRYLRVLDDLGIQLPQEMIRAIEKDRNNFV